MKSIIRDLIYNSHVLSAIYLTFRSFCMSTQESYLKSKYFVKAIISGSCYSRSSSLSLFRTLCAFELSHLENLDRSLNIFWIGGSYDQDYSGTIQALSAKYQVYTYNFRNHVYGPIHSGIELGAGLDDESILKLNEVEVLNQIDHLSQDNIQIDIVMGQLWGNIYSSSLFKQLKTRNCIVINISMDDRLPNLWISSNKFQRHGAVGLGPNVDMTLTTSPNCCEWYWQEGMNSLYFPLASSPEFFSKPRTQSPSLRPIDVLFIGNNYGIRSSIVKYLVQSGIDIHCYGKGWPNGFATAEQSAELYQSAKIVLGIGYVGLSNKITTLKLRDFDAVMSGALYITVYNYDLSKIFAEGSEIEFYRNYAELLSKINFYLSHPEKLLYVTKLGQRKAFDQHSWSYRFAETFKLLGIPVQ